MKKIIFVLYFIITNIIICNAQENESNSAFIIPKKEVLNNKLGFAGSMISGYGLSYEHNINNTYTIEFTASIYGEGGKNNSTSGNSSAYYGGNPTSYLTGTIGTEFQRNFYTSSDSRFYAFGALSYWIDNNTNTNYNYSTSKNEDTESNHYNYIVGIGLGWEITLAKRIVLNLEGGYSYNANYFTGTETFYNNTTQTSSIQPFDRSTYKLGFGAGAGVYYAF